MRHESDDVLEAEPFFLMHPHKLVEDLCEGCTARKSNGAGTNLALTLANHGSHLQRHLSSTFLNGGVNVGRQFLKTGEHGALDGAVGTIVAGRHAVKGDL